jgi:small-conductance mechanosensitive channel
VTFLSVIAAALTIATREIILNIAGSIYIFFSNVIRVGDRVMVQFETKHTVGDIKDISLIKIKLQEVDDYTNLKEIRSVGRTIYIPNSYIFTKVFYNYSLKKNGIINDLIEFEFDINNDFDKIQQVTNELLNSLDIQHKLTFTLNSLKTGIIGVVSYETNYKDASKTRGELSINLLQEYKKHQDIKLKSSRKTVKSKEDDVE